MSLISPNRVKMGTKERAKDSSKSLHFSLTSENILSPEQLDLYELTNLAGFVIDPTVFKIIIDLLKLNVTPTAITQMLKAMISRMKKSTSDRNNTSSSQSMINSSSNNSSHIISKHGPYGHSTGTRDTSQSANTKSTKSNRQPSGKK